MDGAFSTYVGNEKYVRNYSQKFEWSLGNVIVPDGQVPETNSEVRHHIPLQPHEILTIVQLPGAHYVTTTLCNSHV